MRHQRRPRVFGIHAPPPRPTVLAALICATALALPAGAILGLLGLAF